MMLSYMTLPESSWTTYWNSYVFRCVETYLHFFCEIWNLRGNWDIDFFEDLYYTIPEIKPQRPPSNIAYLHNQAYYPRSDFFKYVQAISPAHFQGLGHLSEPADKLEHLFLECENEDCRGSIRKITFNEFQYVCDHCGYHQRMPSWHRIELLVDPGTWKPMYEDMVGRDPINFVSPQKYTREEEFEFLSSDYRPDDYVSQIKKLLKKSFEEKKMNPEKLDLFDWETFTDALKKKYPEFQINIDEIDVEMDAILRGESPQRKEITKRIMEETGVEVLYSFKKSFKEMFEEEEMNPELLDLVDCQYCRDFLREKIYCDQIPAMVRRKWDELKEEMRVEVLYSMKKSFKQIFKEEEMNPELLDFLDWEGLRDDLKLKDREFKLHPDKIPAMVRKDWKELKKVIMEEMEERDVEVLYSLKKSFQEMFEEEKEEMKKEIFEEEKEEMKKEIFEEEKEEMNKEIFEEEEEIEEFDPEDEDGMKEEEEMNKEMFEEEKEEMNKEIFEEEKEEMNKEIFEEDEIKYKYIEVYEVYKEMGIGIIEEEEIEPFDPENEDEMEEEEIEEFDPEYEDGMKEEEEMNKEIFEEEKEEMNKKIFEEEKEEMNPELLDLVDWEGLRDALKERELELHPDEIPAMVRENWKELKKVIMEEMEERDVEVLYSLKNSLKEIFEKEEMNPELVDLVDWQYCRDLWREEFHPDQIPPMVRRKWDELKEEMLVEVLYSMKKSLKAMFEEEEMNPELLDLVDWEGVRDVLKLQNKAFQFYPHEIPALVRENSKELKKLIMGAMEQQKMDVRVLAGLKKSFKKMLEEEKEEMNLELLDLVDWEGFSHDLEKREFSLYFFDIPIMVRNNWNELKKLIMEEMEQRYVKVLYSFKKSLKEMFEEEEMNPELLDLLDWQYCRDVCREEFRCREEFHRDQIPAMVRRKWDELNDEMCVEALATYRKMMKKLLEEEEMDPELIDFMPYDYLIELYMDVIGYAYPKYGSAHPKCLSMLRKMIRLVGREGWKRGMIEEIEERDLEVLYSIKKSLKEMFEEENEEREKMNKEMFEEEKEEMNPDLFSLRDWEVLKDYLNFDSIHEYLQLQCQTEEFRLDPDEIPALVRENWKELKAVIMEEMEERDVEFLYSIKYSSHSVKNRLKAMFEKERWEKEQIKTSVFDNDLVVELDDDDEEEEEEINLELLDLVDWEYFRGVWGKEVHPDEIPAMVRENWEELKAVIMEEMEERYVGVLYSIKNWFKAIFEEEKRDQEGMNPELLNLLDWKGVRDYLKLKERESRLLPDEIPALVAQNWKKLKKLIMEAVEVLYSLKNSLKEMFEEEEMNPELLDLVDWEGLRDALKEREFQLHPDEIPAMVRENWKELKKVIMEEMEQRDVEVLYSIKNGLKAMFEEEEMNPELLDLVDWEYFRDVWREDVHPDEIPAMVRENWKELKKVIMEEMEERDVEVLYSLKKSFQEMFEEEKEEMKKEIFEEEKEEMKKEIFEEEKEEMNKEIFEEEEEIEEFDPEDEDGMKEEEEMNKEMFEEEKEEMNKEIFEEEKEEMNKEIFEEEKEEMNPELLDLVDWEGLRDALKEREFQLHPDEIPAMVRENWKELKKVIMEEMEERDVKVFYSIKKGFKAIFEEEEKNPELVDLVDWEYFIEFMRRVNDLADMMMRVALRRRKKTMGVKEEPVKEEPVKEEPVLCWDVVEKCFVYIYKDEIPAYKEKEYEMPESKEKEDWFDEFYESEESSESEDEESGDEEPEEPEVYEKNNYKEYQLNYQKKTGLLEAVQTGIGTLNSIPIALAVMDSRFIAGSMGTAVGEKITRLIEYATKEFLPLIIVCASGGARMQEGPLSLAQMGKISCALYISQIKKKLFYISILTSDTTGGVTASFAMLGDLLIAEPEARIAFAGERVVNETLKMEVPEGAKEAEDLFLDLIVPRTTLKSVLTHLLEFHNYLPVPFLKLKT